MKKTVNPIPHLLIGTFLIISAFLCVLAVFYFMVNLQKKSTQKIESLQEEVTFVETEREVATRKATELEQEVGRYLDLDKLYGTAQQVYGDSEKDRREGYLWIDRNAKTFVVTLGVLNGIEKGSRVAIYKDQERMGFVRVETPLDVISYVQPIDKSIFDYEEDYYRAVLE